MSTTINLPPELLTVRQTAELLGIGRNRTGRMVADGTIPSIQIDARRYVPRAALKAWIRQNTTQGNK